jgi:methionine-rich copper-binding protein CopC
MLTRPLTISVLGAGVALALTTSAVTAHVRLLSSSPAAGANLPTAPTSVTINVDDELDPDLSHFTVTDASSAEVGTGSVDLTVADRNVMTGAVTITEPGIYTVSYQVAGVDGHVLEGTFSFGYRTSLAIPNPTGGHDADTAMHRPAGRPAAILVVAFVLLGAMAVTATRLPASRR